MTEDNQNAEIAALKQKAEAGDAVAQFALGMKYYKGEGIPRNYAEAKRMFLGAANQGSNKAQNALGIMHDKGIGIPESDKQAINWYRSAAIRGYDDAQFNLGTMFDRGRGVPQNDEETSVNLYRYAAEQGHAKAQFALGMKYYEGEGVYQNYQEAYIWLSLSVANGCDGAIKARQVAKNELIAQAKKTDAYRNALEEANRLRKEMEKGDENLAGKLEEAEKKLTKIISDNIGNIQYEAIRRMDNTWSYSS